MFTQNRGEGARGHTGRMILLKQMFKLFRHGYDGPTECPWAWWLHAWHGSHTSLCPQKDQSSMLRKLLEGQVQQLIDNVGQSQYPGEPLSRASEMELCGLVTLWIFDTFWFPEVQQYPDDNGVASSNLQERVQPYVQPWRKDVDEELSHQWISVLFAWSLPYLTE